MSGHCICALSIETGAYSIRLQLTDCMDFVKIVKDLIWFNLKETKAPSSLSELFCFATKEQPKFGHNSKVKAVL